MAIWPARGSNLKSDGNLPLTMSISLASRIIATREQFLSTFDHSTYAHRCLEKLSKHHVTLPLTYASPILFELHTLGTYVHFSGELRVQPPTYRFYIHEGDSHFRDLRHMWQGLDLTLEYRQGVYANRGENALISRILYSMDFNRTGRKKSADEFLLPDYVRFAIEHYNELDEESTSIAHALMKDMLHIWVETRKTKQPRILRLTLPSQGTRELAVAEAEFYTRAWTYCFGIRPKANIYPAGEHFAGEVNINAHDLTRLPCGRDIFAVTNSNNRLSGSS